MAFLKYYCLPLILTILIAAACSENTGPLAQNMRLSIVYTAWPGNFPLVIAREKGFFKKHGLEVDLVLRQDSLQAMADFASRAYDGAGLSLGSIITISSRTRNIKIILIADRSNGADAVMALPEIDSPALLKNRRIGTMIGGFGELFVLSLLEQAGLSEKDVQLVNADGSQIPELLQNKQIDAGHTWEPFIMQSKKSGAHVLYSSRGTDLILDVIAFHGGVIKNRHEAVQAFVSGWFEAVEYCLQHPQQAQLLVAQTLGIPPEECSFDGIKLFTRPDNKRSFATAEGFASIRAVGKVYASFFVTVGNADMLVDLNALLDASFF